MALRKKLKKINIMKTKKEIRNIIAQLWDKLKKGKVFERKIYLTDKDYMGLEIFENFSKRIIIRLHVENRQYSIVCAEGSIDELDIIWRKFRYIFKREIAEEEFRGNWEFAARLKEVYSLL